MKHYGVQQLKMKIFCSRGDTHTVIKGNNDMHLGHNKVVASKIKEILYASIVKEKNIGG